MIRSATLLGLSAMILAACSTPTTEHESVVMLAPEEIASALLTDETLAQELEIQDQELLRDEHHVLLARSYFVNQGQKPLDIEARTLFKTVRGETLEITEWKRLILIPEQRTPFVSPTVNQMVGRYLLEIRRTK